MSDAKVIDGKKVFSTTDLSGYYGLTLSASFLEKVSKAKPVKVNQGVYWYVNDLPQIASDLVKYFAHCIPMAVKLKEKHE
jgi:hypothetical protein